MVAVQEIEVGDWVEVEKGAWRNNPAGLVGKVVSTGFSCVHLEGDQITPYLDEDHEFLAYFEEVKKVEEPLADWEKELLASPVSVNPNPQSPLKPVSELRSRILEAAHKLADTLEKVDEKHIEQGVVNVGPDPWTRDTVAVTFTVRVSG